MNKENIISPTPAAKAARIGDVMSSKIADILKEIPHYIDEYKGGGTIEFDTVKDCTKASKLLRDNNINTIKQDSFTLEFSDKEIKEQVLIIDRKKLETEKIAEKNKSKEEEEKLIREAEADPYRYISEAIKSKKEFIKKEPSDGRYDEPRYEAVFPKYIKNGIIHYKRYYYPVEKEYFTYEKNFDYSSDEEGTWQSFFESYANPRNWKKRYPVQRQFNNLLDRFKNKMPEEEEEEPEEEKEDKWSKLASKSGYASLEGIELNGIDTNGIASIKAVMTVPNSIYRSFDKEERDNVIINWLKSMIIKEVKGKLLSKIYNLDLKENANRDIKTFNGKKVYTYTFNLIGEANFFKEKMSENIPTNFKVNEKGESSIEVNRIINKSIWNTDPSYFRIIDAKLNDPDEPIECSIESLEINLKAKPGSEKLQIVEESIKQEQQEGTFSREETESQNILSNEDLLGVLNSFYNTFKRTNREDNPIDAAIGTLQNEGYNSEGLINRYKKIFESNPKLKEKYSYAKSKLM